MQLPYGLSKELDVYRMAVSAEELLKQLADNPAHLLLFFQEACEDETWCENNGEAMRLVLEWLTSQFFEEHLALPFARLACESIKKHFHVLDPYIPRNITFKVSERSFPVNSLIFGSGSEFLHQLIQRRCFQERRTKVILKEVPPELFVQIEEYLNTGCVANSWRNEQSALMKLLEISTEWGLEGLMTFCEDILKRYVHAGNAIDLLVRAQGKPWSHLKQACIEQLHAQHLDIYLAQKNEKGLAFEFIKFNDHSLDTFERLKGVITHLICGRALTEEMHFGAVLSKLPQLKTLDISGTHDYTDQFQQIPSGLEELDLSRCGWLTDASFKKMVQLCPKLKRLVLNSDAHLTFLGWGELIKLSKLDQLDISRCVRVGDEEFRVILDTCCFITHLSIEDCTHISDRALFEIPKKLLKLTQLNAARSQITDGILVDLGTSCRELSDLDLTRCENISGKGLISFVKKAYHMKKLVLNRCAIDSKTLKALQELLPQMEIVG